jgi:hypothetical protein
LKKPGLDSLAGSTSTGFQFISQGQYPVSNLSTERPPVKGSADINSISKPHPIVKPELDQGQLAIVAPAKPKKAATRDDESEKPQQFISLPSPGPSSRRERFDWSSENPDIVLTHQPATAVYENPFGQIIIRQEDQYGDTENEHWLLINPEEVTKLFTRALSLAAEISARGRK